MLGLGPASFSIISFRRTSESNHSLPELPEDLHDVGENEGNVIATKSSSSTRIPCVQESRTHTPSGTASPPSSPSKSGSDKDSSSPHHSPRMSPTSGEGPSTPETHRRRELKAKHSTRSPKAPSDGPNGDKPSSRKAERCELSPSPSSQPSSSSADRLLSQPSSSSSSAVHFVCFDLRFILFLPCLSMK